MQDMTLGIEETQGGGEFVADKTAPRDLLRQLRAAKSPARSAAIGRSVVFAVDKRVGARIDLLARLISDGRGMRLFAAVAVEH